MALSANELRIGNYIKGGALHTGIGRDSNMIYYTVNQITDTCAFFKESQMGEYFKDIKPIPLTKEWFLKFGAEKDKYGDLCIIDPTGINTAFYLVEGFIQWTKDCVSPIANFEHVKYVHQFQNLYFIKTDKELKMINTEE